MLLPSFCARSTRCRYSYSEQTCLDYYNRFFDSALPCAEIKASVSDGRTFYDGTRAQACLDFIRLTQECGLEPGSGPDCDAALIGAVADGLPCFQTTDCARTSYCTSTASECPGICRPKLTLGADAGPFELCAAPLYNYSGRCTAPADPGGACSPLGTGGSSQKCVAGYFCGASSICVPYARIGQSCSASNPCELPNSCLAGTCQSMAGTGGTCQASTGLHCMNDLSCYGPRRDRAGTCVVPRSSGGACYSNDDCAWDVYCAGAVKSLPDGGATPGSCQPKLGLGSPCQLTSNGCAKGTYCNGIADAGVCASPLQLGQSCTFIPYIADQCADGICNFSGRCEPFSCQDPTP